MNLDWDTILGAIGGGSIVQLLNFGLNSRKQRSSELEKAYEIIHKDNERLRADNDSQKERLELVEKELYMMRHMSSAINIIPFPQCSKDVDGRMVWLNPMFEMAFLSPLGRNEREFLGKKDIDFWGESIGGTYTGNDSQVTTKKKSIKFIEPVLQPNGEVDDWLVVKSPTFSDDQKTILFGTRAIFIPTKEHQWDLILQ